MVGNNGSSATRRRYSTNPIPTAIRLAITWPVKTPSSPNPASASPPGRIAVIRLLAFSSTTSCPIRLEAWSAITVQPGTTAQNPCTRYSRERRREVRAVREPRADPRRQQASPGGSTTTEVATLMKT